MEKEEILKVFKEYTEYGCHRNVELNFKKTKETKKFNIPQTNLWLYKVGEDIELIEQEPHILERGSVESYATWDTKGVPVIATMDWRGNIYDKDYSYIGEL